MLQVLLLRTQQLANHLFSWYFAPNFRCLISLLINSEAKSNIENWEKNTKKNDDLQVVESVTGGLEASKLTFKYIVQNPQELTKQNEFLYKDLPNMVKLTDKFLEMKKQSLHSDEISRDLDETLLLIKTLAERISKNYHEILMDDVNVIKHEVKFD